MDFIYLVSLQSSKNGQHQYNTHTANSFIRGTSQGLDSDVGPPSRLFV